MIVEYYSPYLSLILRGINGGEDGSSGRYDG